jgi:hypothetical protein
MRFKTFNTTSSIFTFIFIIVLGITSSLHAQIGSGPGTSSGEMLNIGIGSKASSMGGAYTAISEGADANFWNPSGLAGLSSMEIQFGHSTWYQDIKLEYLSAGIPISDKFSAGIGVIYFDYGDFAGFDVNDNPTGTFSGHNIVLSLSLAYKLSEQLSIGVSGKGITEKLEEASASGYAFDLGINYDFGLISTGLALKNLGSGFKYENEQSSFPSKLSAGVALRTFDGKIRVASDINIPRDGYMSLHHGVEYLYLNSISLRGGYSYGLESSGSENNGLIFGFGLKVLKGSVDYSYMPNSDMGGIHKLDFSIRFDQ